VRVLPFCLRLPRHPRYLTLALYRPTSYQHYQYYASHYPQYAQQTSHLVITPPTAPTARPAAATTSTATTTAAAPSQGNSASNDISTLNDAIGSAGVDLRVRVSICVSVSQD